MKASSTIHWLYFELEITAANVQRVILPVVLGKQLFGILANRVDELCSSALDVIFVTHEVSYEAFIEASQLWRSKE